MSLLKSRKPEWVRERLAEERAEAEQQQREELLERNREAIAHVVAREKQQQKARLKSKPSRSRESAPRQINGKPHFLFEWRNAFCAVQDKSRETGLPAPTRHVLLTISMFMNMDGTDAYPGQERIANATGLSLPSVKMHIALAEKRGWLRRKRNHKSRYGLGYSYSAGLPPEGATSLPGNGLSRKRGDSKGATSRD